jgi:hypothetical protein
MSNVNALQIQEFMNFFTGSQHSYGEFIPKETSTGKRSKKEGKYQTVTNKLITIEEYRDHLEGRKGLGIIPVTEGGYCRFAAIDIDIYDDDLSMYIGAVERGNFPLVPFLSKSGGLHLYMFFRQNTPAGKAVEIMRKLSFLLSIDSLVKNKQKGTVEVFPKQVKLKAGESGSFINLPYFDAEFTKQCALRSGKQLTLSELLVYLKEKQTTVEEATTFLEDLEFNDAPPCLQTIYLLDPFKEPGMHRNNYLFSFGVYLKKKNEDIFEQRLHDVNSTFTRPLDEKELERTILSSLRKKDYVYRCKETPCVDFCHKKECKNREFGIGKNEGYFSNVECGQLYQFKLDQPYYEWDVRLQGQEEFLRLRFKSEDEIIKQDAFLRLCMRELHELPSKLKQVEWFNKVNQALKEIVCVRVDQADDTSPYTMFTGLVTDFLTGQAMAETKEQLRTRKPYYDKATDEYLFRGEDLQNFVINVKQFKHYQPNEYHWLYRQMGSEARKIRVGKEGTLRVWALSKTKLESFGKVVTYESIKPDFSEFTAEDF